MARCTKCAVVHTGISEDSDKNMKGERRTVESRGTLRWYLSHPRVKTDDDRTIRVASIEIREISLTGARHSSVFL